MKVEIVYAVSHFFSKLGQILMASLCSKERLVDQDIEVTFPFKASGFGLERAWIDAC